MSLAPTTNAQFQCSFTGKNRDYTPQTLPWIVFKCVLVGFHTQGLIFKQCLLILQLYRKQLQALYPVMKQMVKKMVIMRPSWWRSTNPQVGVSTSSTESTILKKYCHYVDDLKLSPTPTKDDVNFYTALLKKGLWEVISLENKKQWKLYLVKYANELIVL